MSKPVTAYATVTLTIEVRADGCWGPDCTLSQIDKQAKESAMQTIYNADKLHRFIKSGHLKIIGTPTVDRIIVKDT
jgi:hypothetical protein